jgi:membrane dipeptidase
MDRLGMLVDVSHSSDEAFREILDLVGGPVIASHSNCRALCGVGRNMTDEQIRAVGDRGGVIGIHFASGFIDEGCLRDSGAAGFRDKLRAWEADLRTRYPDPGEYLAHRFSWDEWEATDMSRIEDRARPASLARLVDHVDRLVELGGIDAVGVGSDYSLGTLPEDLGAADGLPHLTRALLDRGYSGRDIEKIWSASFLRVLD